MKYQNLFHYIVYKFRSIPGKWIQEVYALFTGQEPKYHLIPEEIQLELKRVSILNCIPDSEFHLIEPLLHLSEDEFAVQLNNLKVLQMLEERGCEIII